ncbi:dihydrofolate reductase family protein [Chryseolinea lacunae]|uniref:Dihydrofolate reductase n=1 Tax=Chryseolinea lacunae TaxID=2801331 RepID=A0ABS1KPX3_9BACT|nr:dihydrofolate reductase family protein [Chryseolinea lacunae]MBL0741520.1 dihydrofolate reductase [Chryseolinea lacunae]
MRKVILNLALSLDGFIAGPQGEYDWCFTDADYGMTNFLNSIDTTVMGGKSYRLLLQYGPPYPEYTNYVFTRTEKGTPYPNVVFTSDDIPDVVRALKEKDGKNIWLFGGAEIIHPLLEEDLVDELMLSIHPLLLGDGLPLFRKLNERKLFKLTDTIAYPSGLVQLYYKK